MKHRQIDAIETETEILLIGLPYWSLETEDGTVPIPALVKETGSLEWRIVPWTVIATPVLKRFESMLTNTKERNKMSANKDRILLLVQALESGEYKQGKGYLTRILFPHWSALYERENELDCASGVACKVAIKHGLKNVVVQAFYTMGASASYKMYNGSESIMPSEVAQWYGFSSDNPTIVGTGLIELNDREEADFNKIAKLIRQEFNL